MVDRIAKRKGGPRRNNLVPSPPPAGSTDLVTNQWQVSLVKPHVVLYQYNVSFHDDDLDIYTKQQIVQKKNASLSGALGMYVYHADMIYATQKVIMPLIFNKVQIRK